MESAPPAVKASVAPAHGMMNDNVPTKSGVAPSGGVGQWDRFELKLSKPSGKQKLGMVLKHAVNEVSKSAPLSFDTAVPGRTQDGYGQGRRLFFPVPVHIHSVFAVQSW